MARLAPLLVMICFACFAFCQIQEVTLGVLWQFNSTRNVARIAIDDLRAGKFPGILSGLTINVLEANDLGSSTVIVQTLPITGYCTNTKLALGIVGGSFSSTSTQLQGLLAPLQIPQISPSATSTELSDETSFPYFFRTAPPDGQQAAAMAALIKAYGWTKCSIITSSDSYGRGGLREFLSAASAVNIDVVASLTVQFIQSDYSVEIKALKKAKTTVNIWFAPDANSTSAFVLQAAEAGLFGDDYVWIFSDAYAAAMIPAGPTDTRVHPYLKGSLAILAAGGYGPVYDDLKKTWDAQYPSTGLGTYSVLAYDAVIALAAGIDATIKSGMNPANGSALRQSLFKVNVTGASGPVAFDDVGDRIGFFWAYGVKYDGAITANQFSVELLGTIVGSANATFVPPKNFTWADGTTNVPSDRLPRKSRIAGWGWALIAIGIVAVLGGIALIMYFVFRQRFHLIVVPRQVGAAEEWAS